MDTTRYHIRMATPADAPVIAHHRRAMFDDIGVSGDTGTMQAAFAEWVKPHLVSGHYLGWMVIDTQAPAETIVGGAGVRIVEWAPMPADPEAHLRPYLLNVYVEPDHRQRGIARALVEAIIAWAHDHQPRVGALTLHASEYGRPLYESLGFIPTNEMRLMIKDKHQHT